MRLGSFRFTLQEAGGAMGDFGTLFPLALGYIVVCGMDPVGLLVMMGLANIATGLAYRLPMPIEPMKAIAVAAIAQGWEPATIHAAGFATGLLWLLFSLTGLTALLARLTPPGVTRGIQVALGILLGAEALKFITGAWLPGAGALAVILLLRRSRYFPPALVLILSGLGIMALQGVLGDVRLEPPRLPSFRLPSPDASWDGMVRGGFAQLGLTAANAIIATTALISRYWPERVVKPRSAALSTGLMNLVSPLFGGMPMCHGSGGLAAQYAFGARTGGANLIEGTLEILLGIFLGTTVAVLFGAFPMAILGAMMLAVGYKLVLFAREERFDASCIPFLVTVAASLLGNMAVGLLAGLCSSHLLARWTRKGRTP